MTTQPPQQLTEQHIPYAKALASKVRQQIGLPTHVDQDELEGWAMLGLAQAADRFDPARGVCFTTFAYRRVVGAVLNGIGKMHDAPAAAKSRARKQARLQEALPETPDTDHPAEAIAQATRRVRVVLELDAIAEAAAEDNSPLDQADDREAIVMLREAIAGLPQKLGQVVQLHHLEQLPMAEVAQRLGISAPTVCRWNKKAMDLIAKAMGGPAAVAC